MALPATSPAAPSQGANRILSGLLEARTGQVLSENRAWRTETALRPVMRNHSIADVDALAAKLVSARDPRLEQDVVNALLNNESSFFRDLQTFDMLYRDILPYLHDARRDRVLRMMIGEVSVVVLAGIGIGVVAALVATRLVASFLFGLTASDPETWIASAGVLLGVSVVAVAAPAWRAARMDPMTALREE